MYAYACRATATPRVALDVEDTGIGIAPDDIAKALTPFGQVVPQDGEQREGTGLGLPIAANLVGRHGGSLHIESQPGQGTRVRILLPPLNGSRGTARFVASTPLLWTRPARRARVTRQREEIAVMQIGIHLPHIGRKAGPDAIRRAAVQAEELGFADVWVSEHIIIPRTRIIRPRRILGSGADAHLGGSLHAARKLGTSVLVLPMRHPLPLAKELATLQNLSQRTADPGRRRRLDGGGVQRSRRAVPRAWPADGRRHRHDEGGVERGPGDVPDALDTSRDRQMRMQPLPCAPIPIWIGGSSDAAIARALRLDGWHGSRVTPEQAPAMVQRLRAARPDAGFTVSLRTAMTARTGRAARQAGGIQGSRRAACAGGAGGARHRGVSGRGGTRRPLRRGGCDRSHHGAKAG